MLARYAAFEARSRTAVLAKPRVGSPVVNWFNQLANILDNALFRPGNRTFRAAMTARTIVASPIAALALTLFANTASADEPVVEKKIDDSVACAVDRYIGVTDTEAAAVESIVCGQLQANAPRGQYRIRIVKVGSKVVISLGAPNERSASADKQLVLASIDEVTVAAPRFAEAASEQKALGDTGDMNNVVGDEARKPKKKSAELHFILGVIGASAVGHGTGGGANLGMSVGSDRWTFVGDLRIAADAFTSLASESTSTKSVPEKTQEKAGFVYASLGGGARHHLSSRDTAPFVGAGLALARVSVASDDGTVRSSNTGAAVYGELGLDLLRTHQLGGAVVLRVDAPAFAIEELGADQRRKTSYAPVIAAGIAMRF